MEAWDVFRCRWSWNCTSWPEKALVFKKGFGLFLVFGLEEDVFLALVGEDVDVCGVCDVFDLCIVKPYYM